MKPVLIIAADRLYTGNEVFTEVDRAITLCNQEFDKELAARREVQFTSFQLSELMSNILLVTSCATSSKHLTNCLLALARQLGNEPKLNQLASELTARLDAANQAVLKHYKRDLRAVDADLVKIAGQLHRGLSRLYQEGDAEELFTAARSAPCFPVIRSAIDALETGGRTNNPDLDALYLLARPFVAQYKRRWSKVASALTRLIEEPLPADKNRAMQIEQVKRLWAGKEPHKRQEQLRYVFGNAEKPLIPQLLEAESGEPL